MKIIVGLGNPGTKYAHTRHNAGFLAIDHYLHGKETIHCQSKFNGQICELHFTAHTHGAAPVKVFFVKPQTYMNKSGEAVRALTEFYKINIATDLLVIHDEVDLKFGFYKVAFDSRPAGHNGVKNIVEELGTQEFHRIRIGVESRLSRHESPTDVFVLQNFSTDELHNLTSAVLPHIDKEIESFILS